MSQLQGHFHPKFTPVINAFQRQLAKARGGSALCIYHRGEKVVDVWGGRKDAAGNPWQEDTLSVSFSTTKGVTATLAHQLVANQVLDFDDPVARYWPEFAVNGKERITLRDLLTHRAGLYGLRNLALNFEQACDWDTVTGKLAAAAPNREHAPHSVYHALSYGWLVAETLQRASGKSLNELLQNNLVSPLKLDGCFIGTPTSEQPRVATLLMGGGPKKKSAPVKPSRLAQYRTQTLRRVFSGFEDAVQVQGFTPKNLCTEQGLSAAIPAANGTFTARSLARLYAALGNNGQLEGAAILPGNWKPHLTGQQVKGLDRAMYAPMNWRLGHHQPFVLGARRPKHSFGHFGFGGSGAWADPDRQLALALTVNSGAGTPWGDFRIMELGGRAIWAADGRG